MSFHPSVDDALDTVDAMVFSGDALNSKENRKNFKEFLGRWGRELQIFEDLSNKITPEMREAATKACEIALDCRRRHRTGFRYWNGIADQILAGDKNALRTLECAKQ